MFAFIVKCCPRAMIFVNLRMITAIDVFTLWSFFRIFVFHLLQFSFCLPYFFACHCAFLQLVKCSKYLLYFLDLIVVHVLLSAVAVLFLLLLVVVALGMLQNMDSRRQLTASFYMCLVVKTFLVWLYSILIR